MATPGVLGPLLLEGDAGPVRIGSARQRRLLAVLAAHLGRPVDAGRLADLMWADDVPADSGPFSGAGAVQALGGGSRRAVRRERRSANAEAITLARRLTRPRASFR